MQRAELVQLRAQGIEESCRGRLAAHRRYRTTIGMNSVEPKTPKMLRSFSHAARLR